MCIFGRFVDKVNGQVLCHVSVLFRASDLALNILSIVCLCDYHFGNLEVRTEKQIEHYMSPVAQQPISGLELP